MKLPDHLQICGVRYRLKQDPATAGGAFDEASLTITVGTRYPQDIPDTLLHEVIEAVLAKRMMRLVKEVGEPDNGDYVFVFTHEQFELAVGDIAAALRGIKL